MQVISLARTKELLGITDSSYDTAINAQLPYIDATVKQLSGNRFNYRVIGEIESGSNEMSVVSIDPDYYYYNYYGYHFDWRDYPREDLQEYLQIGQQITGTGIPADTYITEVFYNMPVDTTTQDFIPKIELSANATETVTNGAMYLGCNIAQQRVIAKGIFWLIDQTNVNIPSATGISSKTMGKLSISYNNADSKIDGKYGMPAWFIKAFPKYMVGH